MAAFEAGSWVWFADEDDGFLPGQVTSSFHAGEVGSVTLQDGEVVNFDAKQSADLRQMDIQVRPHTGWCHVRHNGALLDPSSDHANQVLTLRMESWMHGLLRVRGGWDGAGSLSLRPEWRFYSPFALDARAAAPATCHSTSTSILGVRRHFAAAASLFYPALRPNHPRFACPHPQCPTHTSSPYAPPPPPSLLVES